MREVSFVKQRDNLKPEMVQKHEKWFVRPHSACETNPAKKNLKNGLLFLLTGKGIVYYYFLLLV